MLKHMHQPMGRRLSDPSTRDIGLKAAASKDILHVYVTKLWIPILTQFHKDGHLRPGINLVDAGKWLVMIEYALLDGRWIRSNKLRRLVESFVAPSVLKD